jgi:hypothetical protein
MAGYDQRFYNIFSQGAKKVRDGWIAVQMSFLLRLQALEQGGHSPKSQIRKMEA